MNKKVLPPHPAYWVGGIMMEALAAAIWFLTAPAPQHFLDGVWTLKETMMLVSFWVGGGLLLYSLSEWWGWRQLISARRRHRHRAV